MYTLIYQWHGRPGLILIPELSMRQVFSNYSFFFLQIVIETVKSIAIVFAIDCSWLLIADKVGWAAHILKIVTVTLLVNILTLAFFDANSPGETHYNGAKTCRVSHWTSPNTPPRLSYECNCGHLGLVLKSHGSASYLVEPPDIFHLPNLLRNWLQ